MTVSLLPPNSTQLERAIEAAVARRFDEAELRIGDLWNPDRCPAHLLGLLAWALSVDIWDDEWSEARKRRVIANSLIVHGRKGTVGAVKRALGALDLGLEIVEWFDAGGDPHTFEIAAFADYIFDAGLGVDAGLLTLIAAQIDAVKPVRAHYSLKVGENFDTGVHVGTGISAVIEHEATLDFVMAEAA